MAQPDNEAVPVYLDHAATTPMRGEAVEAMLPYLSGAFGNASGTHAVARAAKTALESAREVVAEALGATPGEVVFTSGGTEADNLAVKGAAWAARAQGTGDGIVTTTFEHHAVLHSCDRLESEGFRVARTRVTSDGIVDLDALAAALDERTVVVSVMLVNNEVGTIQPLDEVAELVRERAPRALLHTDAVQAMPWLDVANAASHADLIAVAAHKFGGPKGVGALVVRRAAKSRVTPLLDGGGHERGLRSGTYNVGGIVAMAAAITALADNRKEEVERAAALRDRLVAGLAAVPGPHTTFNGDPARKIAGNCHVHFPGVEAEALLLMLDREGIYAAAGSACQSGSMDPSHVLMAMGMRKEDALSSIRLSLGWCSTESDVDIALDVIPQVVGRVRSLSTRRR